MDNTTKPYTEEYIAQDDGYLYRRTVEGEIFEVYLTAKYIQDTEKNVIEDYLNTAVEGYMTR